MLVRSAPSAIRIPSSRVRCVTVSAITPYNPTLANTSASPANVASNAIVNRRVARLAPIASSIVVI